MCLIFAFCIKFVRFLNIMFVVLFCLICFGPFSGQPDISQDCQISQLGSPADCQIFWSYFYPCTGAVYPRHRSGLPKT